MSMFTYFTILQSRPIGQSSDPGVGAIIFLVFVALAMIAIAAFTIGVIIYSANKRSDRAAKLQAVGRQMGFSFVAKPRVPEFLKNTRFAQWYPAVGTGIHNLLSGSVKGTSVFIFDFGYTKTMGGFGSATYRETVVCIPRATGEPFFFCREATLVAPEHIHAFLDAALQAYAQTATRVA